MNKTIELTYEGETFKLEYDKMAVKALENSGVNILNLTEKPMNNIDAMFKCAFLKHNPDITIAKIDEIFESCPNKMDLFTTLIEMVTEACSILTNEPEDTKNVSWTVTEMKKPSVEKKAE